MKKITTFLLLSIFISSTVNASSYYPKQYASAFQNGTIKNEALKEALFNVLSSKHEYHGRGKYDTLGCSTKAKKCYTQKVLGYRGARKVMFGKIHLEEGSNGYYIQDVYCRKKFTNSTGVGPGRIPDHNRINCEHTWPQSKFSRRFNKEMQKSDLHHLYPTDSKANGVRGHYEFANVTRGKSVDNCSPSRTEKGGKSRFEPPTEHKGNVARAIFYFSVRYQLKISREEEATLKEWNNLDPVDAKEYQRNETVFKVQKNRNPFIDFPHLADSISNF